MTNKKKKILYLVEAMGGGVVTYIETLANGLCDEFDFVIAYGMRDQTPDDLQSHFDKRVKLVEVKNFTRPVNPIKDFLSYREIKKIIKEEKPDLVHLHSSKAGALGRLFFCKKDYKMMYTPHGYSFLMQDARLIMRKAYRLIEKICGRKKCLTVACGRGEWQESLSVCKDSTFISNGVDTKLIDTILKDDVKKDEKFRVFTVGRVEFQKNPELFNEIAELLPNIEFVWIGQGELEKKLTSPNIKVTGWMTREEVFLCANRCDVFILPSRWEGLPLALLEAMYMKKACIVSDVVGNRDIVNNGVTGYICETAEEFAERIKQLEIIIDNKMINNAYNTIVDHYNDSWLCDRYRDLYLEILLEED